MKRYDKMLLDWMPSDGETVVTAHDYFTSMLTNDPVLHEFQDTTLHDMLGADYDSPVYNSLYTVFVQVFNSYLTMNAEMYKSFVSVKNIHHSSQKWDEIKKYTGMIYSRSAMKASNTVVDHSKSIQNITEFMAGIHYNHPLFKYSSIKQNQLVLSSLQVFSDRLTTRMESTSVDKHVVRNIADLGSFQKVFLSDTDYYNTFHEQTSGNQPIDVNRLSSYLRVVNKYSWVLNSREIDALTFGGQTISGKLNYYKMEVYNKDMLLKKIQCQIKKIRTLHH
jgi:hypothetical protein